MAETVKDYSGACWNALMEEETKESIARLYIDSFDASRAEKAAVAELAEALHGTVGALMTGRHVELAIKCGLAALAKHASPKDAT